MWTNLAITIDVDIKDATDSIDAFAGTWYGFFLWFAAGHLVQQKIVSIYEFLSLSLSNLFYVPRRTP